MSDLLQSALWYAGRGWRVFPCKPKDKLPACKWADAATTDPAKIKALWAATPGANIGLVCGRDSGLVALDVDAGHGGVESLMQLLVNYGQLPATVESLTGGGGRHILFTHPGIEIRNSASKIGPGLDIRGDGGYIVVPPSIHPSGRAYAWEETARPDHVELKAMPEWLLRLLAEPVAVAQAGQQITGMIAPPVGDKIGSGQRNQTLASLAGTMRRRGMDADAIYAGLWSENTRHCEPPLSADEVMSIAKSFGRYIPANPPRIQAAAPVAQPRDPMNAYEVAAVFLDLLDHLDGRSIKVGIPNFDRSTGGLERQTLAVLAARPSMGKSTLAWEWARNVAAGSTGLRSYFFSLEMSAAALWAKAACGACGIRWRDVRNLEASPAQIAQITDKTAELMDLYGDRLLVDDKSNTSATILAGIERHRPDLVVVDHLRLVADKTDSEVKRLGDITQVFKDAAKSYNCAFVCLAQLNREVEHQDNKRPQLKDLRDSGQIEENADVVFMMHRDDYYEAGNPGYRPNFKTEILIRKFRDDVLNQQVNLKFDPRHQWFGPWED
jgi:hypothetical protein